MKLAQTVVEQRDEKAILDVFADTKKPSSTKKSSTKAGHSPMKPKKAQLFLEELLQHQSEIVQDSSQLKTFLDKTKQQDLLEIVLRTLLDLPTYEMKGRLIEVLSLPNEHSMVFSLTLADILNRLFSLRSILAPVKSKLGLADDDINPKDAASLLLARKELGMLCSLAALINKLCLKDAEHHRKKS